MTANGVTFTWADGANQWTGIQFDGAGASGSRLENSVIEHASGIFSYWWGSYYYGVIYLTNSSPTITGNTINNSSAVNGIYISNGSPVISNNTISGMTGNGIYVEGSSTPIVNGNTITNNGYGIYVYYSGSGMSINGNIIQDNANYGIYLDNSNPNIFRNVIQSNATGIYCTGSNPVIGGTAENGNDITDNTNYSVYNNTSSITVNARYNYWGSPSGTATTGPNAVYGNVDYSDYLTSANISDNTPPNAPIVNSVTPTNNTTPTWTWTSGGGGGNSVFSINLMEQQEYGSRRMERPILRQVS